MMYLDQPYRSVPQISLCVVSVCCSFPKNNNKLIYEERLKTCTDWLTGRKIKAEKVLTSLLKVLWTNEETFFSISCFSALDKLFLRSGYRLLSTSVYSWLRLIYDPVFCLWQNFSSRYWLQIEHYSQSVFFFLFLVFLLKPWDNNRKCLCKLTLMQTLLEGF